jgi:hypothetical protein
MSWTTAIVIVVIILSFWLILWRATAGASTQTTYPLITTITAPTWYSTGKPYKFEWKNNELTMNFYDDRGYFKGVAIYVFTITQSYGESMTLQLVRIVSNPSQIAPVKVWNLSIQPGGLLLNGTLLTPQN